MKDDIQMFIALGEGPERLVKGPLSSPPPFEPRMNTVLSHSVVLGDLLPCETFARE